MIITIDNFITKKQCYFKKCDKMSEIFKIPTSNQKDVNAIVFSCVEN